MWLVALGPSVIICGRARQPAGKTRPGVRLQVGCPLARLFLEPGSGPESWTVVRAARSGSGPGGRALRRRLPGGRALPGAKGLAKAGELGSPPVPAPRAPGAGANRCGAGTGTGTRDRGRVGVAPLLSLGSRSQAVCSEIVVVVSEDVSEL